MKSSRALSTTTKTTAVKIVIHRYASSIRFALGECGVTGAKPPLPAKATPAAVSATPRPSTKTKTLRLTSDGILRDGGEMIPSESVGDFRRTRGQSPPVLEAAPQAVP